MQTFSPKQPSHMSQTWLQRCDVTGQRYNVCALVSGCVLSTLLHVSMMMDKCSCVPFLVGPSDTDTLPALYNYCNSLCSTNLAQMGLVE